MKYIIIAMTLFLASCGAACHTSGGGPSCCGDCNADAVVDPGEQALCGSIFSDSGQLPACPACDCDEDGEVSISELQTVSNNANEGCPK